MKFTSYIWDFDGTLFDTYPHIASAFEKIMERDGISFEHEDVLRALYVNFGKCREKYGLSKEQYDNVLAIERSYTSAPFPSPYPGTAALLRAVCESGGKNYLYTHRNRMAWSYLSLWGLDKYFVGGVDGTMGFPSKPAPDAVEHICRINNIDKKSAVMIGDRGIDVLAGVNAGCSGCLFKSHPFEDDTSSASYTVESMLELAKIFEIPMHESDILSETDAKKIKQEASKAAIELCEAAHLKAGNLVVIGCSSSEITGERIGSSSSPEAAAAVLAGLLEVFTPRGIEVAAQCCEHLNRALIVEKSTALAHGCEIVNVVPMPKAGGAFATMAWRHFNEPAAVSEIKADAGLDIGGTLIGMHLKRVAVPLRLPTKTIGTASLAAARVRAPFTGGERAIYDNSLM